MFVSEAILRKTYSTKRNLLSIFINKLGKTKTRGHIHNLVFYYLSGIRSDDQ